MSDLSGKKILIFQQRNWGKTIGHFLATKLQAEGAKLAAVVFKRSTNIFIREQQDVHYDLLINDDAVTADPKAYLAGQSFSVAEICADLGIDSIWPLIHSVRNFVRSYGKKYYYGYSKNVSDEQMIMYVQAVYKYLKICFDEFRPDVILAPNFVVLPFIMFNLYAERHDIKMIAVTDSKVKGVFVFTHGFRDDHGPFLTRIDELNSGKVISPNSQKARQYIAEFRGQFKNPDHAVTEQQRSLGQIIRHELSPYYHILRWYISRPINPLPNLGTTTDWRPPRIILRDHYCQIFYRRFARTYPYYPYAKLGKYAYFPLQFQPEASIDVIAPYFSNQIETARLVAMSLPEDYTLAVKEHPAMVGLRPPSYLKKIAGCPNVKVVDYRISSEQMIKNASLVISPNSTSLAEAAFFHKPAIQLGDLGITKKLPNVFFHSDLSTLSGKIKEVLQRNLNTVEYERSLENFIAAAYDTGFTYGYTKAWSKGMGEDSEELWKIYKKEIIKAL